MVEKTNWNNYILDNGFTMIPNLLLDYQNDLGLTDNEVLFIIKISRFSNGWFISDNKISTKSSKTMQRRRNDLKKKGYLTTQEKKVLMEEGKWYTVGLVYDLSGLNDALNKLFYKKRFEKKSEKIMIPSFRTDLMDEKLTEIIENYFKDKKDE